MADQKKTDLIHEWLLPYNSKYYDLESALTNEKIIDWVQTRNLKSAEPGDLIYIYESAPFSGIRYKGAILKVNKQGSDIDDRKYNIPVPSADTPLTDKPCMEIAVFRDYTLTDELAYKELNSHGVKSRIQCPQRLKAETSAYLHSIDKLQIQVDRFDGVIPGTCLFPFPIMVDEHLDDGNPYPADEALDDAHSDEEKLDHAKALDMDALQKIAEKQSLKEKTVITTSTTQTYRDPYIAAYTKRRANGICQLCGNPAPFNSADGEPYLESHHLIWLSKGGADSIYNTVALCPNCHRKMHVVNDPKDIARLTAVIGKYKRS